MKKLSKSLIVLVIASATFSFLATSCRTMQGFGSDVKHTGDHIEEAAKR